MMKKICYLAGGFHSDWQNNTMRLLKNLNFYDPKSKKFIDYGLPTTFGDVIDVIADAIDLPDFDGDVIFKEEMNFAEYTAWDLWAIRNSDVVFLYQEKTSPGVAAFMEAAYAKGLGKTVIVCTELNNSRIPDRYIAFVEAFGDIIFHDYSEAIKFLSKL